MQEHERIEELLAGHALRALSGEDAIEADRLLTEHVPSCPLCRETLTGFRGVADELALAPDPAPPPELLLARVRRSIREAPVTRRRSFLATAAGVAALVGVSALSLSLGTRATSTDAHVDRMAELVDALSQPGSEPVTLESLGTAPMVEVSGPSAPRIIVAGHGVPKPAENCVYVIWIGDENGFQRLGTVMPDEYGFVYRTFHVDPSTFDRILITEERSGTRPVAPRTDSPHTWQATL